MWKSHPTAQKVLRHTSQIDIDNFDKIPEETIKVEIARQITTDLIESNLITIVKEPKFMDPFGKEVYKGYLDIVKDPNLNNVMIDEYIYEVQNKKFTHEQIEEAVKNTFPEYFI
jgi:hypothetical protein